MVPQEICNQAQHLFGYGRRLLKPPAVGFFRNYFFVHPFTFGSCLAFMKTFSAQDFNPASATFVSEPDTNAGCPHKFPDGVTIVICKFWTVFEVNFICQTCVTLPNMSSDTTATWQLSPPPQLLRTSALHFRTELEHSYFFAP